MWHLTCCLPCAKDILLFSLCAGTCLHTFDMCSRALLVLLVHVVKQAPRHTVLHTAFRPHRRDDQVSRLSSAAVAASDC